ncbi:MAG: cadherin domain-containing protein, partial [Gammaproteobacteria bacterium]|nr:cadherin domain-containing protein [Gammaproteobacteria bacterium]
SGTLAFISAPDYETPADIGLDNTYEIQVTADDGNGGTDVQAISVTVLDGNEAPQFASSSTASIPENTTAVLTVTATDEDVPSQIITYSISGGVDQALFSINPSTGNLTFTSAPNFEAPADSGNNNTYDVQVTATDDGTPITSSFQDISITVTNVNDVPSLISISNSTINERTDTSSGYTVGTLTTTDDDPLDTFTYTVVGGADQANFSIGGVGLDELILTAGVLNFETKPTFEVIVRTTDPGPLTYDETFIITVNDLNDAPVITSIPPLSIEENIASVMTVTTTDEDLPPQTISYSITGGTDQALFSIDNVTGDLSFITAPNYEAPADSGLDNIYDVQVTATDSGTPVLTAVQDISFSVTDVNDAPVIISTATPSVDEGVTTVVTVIVTDEDLPAQIIDYSITGGADQLLFNINPSTGELSFITAPDAEAPADSDTNNIYEVQVTATDNGTPALTAVQDISATIIDINDPPVIISSNIPGILENTTFVATVSATDVDLPAQNITYSITGGA